MSETVTQLSPEIGVEINGVHGSAFVDARVAKDCQAALDARMVDEGMDRSEAMADLASDLQDAADAGLPPESVLSAGLPAGWPPQETELMSRERIEAEGFSFVAPDVGTPMEELGDVWSRNGKDHAGEDMRLR